jgi:dihydroxyacetone kinase
MVATCRHKKSSDSDGEAAVMGEVKMYKMDALHHSTLPEQLSATTQAFKKLAESLRQEKVKHNPCSLPSLRRDIEH